MDYLKKMKKCKDPESLIDQWVSDETIQIHQDKGKKYGLLHAAIVWEDEYVFENQLKAILGKTEDLPDLRTELLEMKDANKYTPQMLAIELNQHLAATKLLKCGCNPNASNGQQSVQSLAALSNNRELIIDLLKFDVDINFKCSGLTSLMSAIKEDCQYSVEELINNIKIDWKATDSSGNNQLLLAIENNNNGTAGIILEKLDAFNELPDSDPKKSIAKFMISHKNKEGMASVHLAASMDRQMIYSILMKKADSFDVDQKNLKDSTGRTGEQYFAEAKEVQYEKELMKKQKSTDSQMARKRKNEDIKKDAEIQKRNELLQKQKQKEAEVRQILNQESEQSLIKYKIMMFFIVVVTALYLQMKWQETKGSNNEGINKDAQAGGIFDI